MSKIQPRTLKGFRDFLPETMIPREQCMWTAREVFRRYGFAPIDTPTLEYLEILTGKGSEETDRQMYQFTDHGGRKVGMRFDLTIPLARFAAQHAQALGTPFKRYHIAPVWRGESPQAGRYREFVQCDFDTIGTESVVADIETVVVIDDLMRSLGFSKFHVHLNNRQVLTGLLEHLGLVERAVPVLRSLDKLAKIGPDATIAEMQSTAGVSEDEARSVLRLAELQGDYQQILAALPEVTGNNPTAGGGIERLRTTITAALAAGVEPSRLKLDVGIARGLDYYTGVVFETFLDELPGIGSVCSGGRYDDLAGLYTKQHLPGVGASLGLDRLLAAMGELGMLPSVRTPAAVFIPYFDEARLTDYLRIATLLRTRGIGCEVYPDAKKLGQQLKYADQRGFAIALIAGARELDEGKVQVKDLHHKIATEVDFSWDQPEPLFNAIATASQLSAGSLLA